MIGKAIGRVVPIPKGDWSVTTEYNKLDIVYNDTKSYIARQDVPVGISLTTSEYWQVISQGTPGLQGPTGPQGIQGPTGNCYLPVFSVDFTDGVLYAYEYQEGPHFEIDAKGDLYIELRSD